MTVIHQSSALTEGTNYTYDAAGNRVSKRDTFQITGQNPTQTLTNYGYDSIYELTQAVVNGTAAESYTYDAVGNRLSSLGAPSYSYNNSNELTSIGKKTFSYDANGNTLTKTAPNGTTMYAWDFENRLTSVTLPKGSVLHYQYDPFGRRIFSDGTGRIFVYDGDNVIEDLDLTGKAVARYTDGLGIDEPLEETASGGIDYYEADGLGSISSLTDSTGSVANTYAYSSFGSVTASSSAVSNRFFFTARENVAKTDLLYYRARYYDPTVGRFISEDPIAFNGDLNFYAYAGNSPANFTDPEGLFTVRDALVRRRTLGIDEVCGPGTGGACTAVKAALVICTCTERCGGWKANAELRIYGTMYIYSGPWATLPRKPKDSSVVDAATAIAHEYRVHINPAIAAVTPLINALEGRKFTSASECHSECDKTSLAVDSLFKQTLRSTQEQEDKR